jgi:peptidoglycan/LPS O-acetylase OafA/YrhL
MDGLRALAFPYDLRFYSKSSMAVSVFVSNITFSKERDYFDPFTEFKPLHT